MPVSEAEAVISRVTGQHLSKATLDREAKLSRHSPIGEIKRRLGVAIKELEEKGYLVERTFGVIPQNTK